MTTSIRRPGPLRRLAYAFGAGLPPAHRDWVLHDATCRTWQLRHLLRSTVQLTPVAVLLYLLIPGEPWVRGCAVLGGLLIGWLYAMAYVAEAVEHRVTKAGWPRGHAAAVREEAHAEQRAAGQARYEARWRTPPPGSVDTGG